MWSVISFEISFLFILLNLLFITKFVYSNYTTGLSCILIFCFQLLILQERKKKAQEKQDSSDDSDQAKGENKEEEPIVLRPLTMEDMKQAKAQVTCL